MKLRVADPKGPHEHQAAMAASSGSASSLTQADHGHGEHAPPNVAKCIIQSHENGADLPGDVRSTLEPRFGYSFRDVRIHADAAASKATGALHTRAFTHGSDLYFAPGVYRPGSPDGRRLLTHELAHVVQQNGAHGLVQMDPPNEEAAAQEEAQKVEKLKAELKAAYDFSDVVDGDETWTSDHLQQVKDALKLLPATDKPALKGVVLERVSSLGSKTAGQFSSSQSVTDTAVVNEATLKLDDKAFAGGAPGSHSLIVHEVGHAVATIAARTATQAAHEAVAASNALVEQSNQAVEDFNTAVEERNDTVDPLNDAVKELAAARKSGDKARITAATADHQAKKQAFDQKLAEENRLKKIMQTAEANTKAAQATSASKEATARATRISDADLAAIKKRVDDGKAAQDKAAKKAAVAVEGFGADEKTESASYVAAAEAAAEAIETFANDTAAQDKSESAVEAEIATAQAAVDARNTAREVLKQTNDKNPALAALAPVETAQDAWFEAAQGNAMANDRTVRVQKFVTFVEKNGIAPITAYAAENWPHAPEEFYAEAYSMFLVKPKDLEAASKPLYDWFKAGKFR